MYYLEFDPQFVWLKNHNSDEKYRVSGIGVRNHLIRAESLRDELNTISGKSLGDKLIELRQWYNLHRDDEYRTDDIKMEALWKMIFKEVE